MSRWTTSADTVHRMIFPRSLRYQLLSRILIILAVLLLVIGVLQYLLMERFLYQNKAASIQRQIQSVPGEMWERLDYSTQKPRGPAEPFIFFPGSSVAFIDKEGYFKEVTSINSASSDTIPRLDEQVYKDALQLPRRDKATFRIVNPMAGGEQLVILQTVRSFNGVRGVVQVSMSTKPLKSDLYRHFMLFLALAFAAVIGGLLAFLPAIRRTLIPLSRMVATVEKIDSGKLNERLPTYDQPMEIERLSHSFNLMLERLGASFHAEQDAKERMRRFVSDASHELRTPLTSIHGFLEVLLRGAASDSAQLDRALKSMHGESERINKLVLDLLQLAKLDREPEARFTPCNLAHLIEEMEPQLRILAGQRNIKMVLNKGIVLLLDTDKMKQVLLNLYQNAVQHTDPQVGAIQITVSKVEQGVELTIQDNGAGIPPEHLPHLFDRFYRIDSSRARRHGGAGLGLSISRSLVELHGGTLTVESRLGEGSLFRAYFPFTGAPSVEHPQIE